MVVLDQGHQFQKTFVDASQFLGAHVAPPDGHRASTRPYPGQLVDRVVEAVVGDIRGIEVRTPVGREDPTEGGQPQGRFALGEGAQDDSGTFPPIGVAVVGGSPGGSVADPGHGVAVAVPVSDILGRAGRVQDIPRLGRQDKYEAVDQAQEFAVVVIGREGAGAQGILERDIAGMVKEPLPQDRDGFADAVAQAGQGALAVFLPFNPPPFQRAVGRG